MQRKRCGGRWHRLKPAILPRRLTPTAEACALSCALPAIQIPQSFRQSDVNAFSLHVDPRAKFRRQRHQHFSIAGIDGQQRDASGKFDIAHGAHRRLRAPLPTLRTRSDRRQNNFRPRASRAARAAPAPRIRAAAPPLRCCRRPQNEKSPGRRG